MKSIKKLLVIIFVIMIGIGSSLALDINIRAQQISSLFTLNSFDINLNEDETILSLEMKGNIEENAQVESISFSIYAESIGMSENFSASNSVTNEISFSKKGDIYTADFPLEQLEHIRNNVEYKINSISISISSTEEQESEVINLGSYDNPELSWWKTITFNQAAEDFPFQLDSFDYDEDANGNEWKVRFAFKEIKENIEINSISIEIDDSSLHFSKNDEKNLVKKDNIYEGTVNFDYQIGFENYVNYSIKNIKVVYKNADGGYVHETFNIQTNPEFSFWNQTICFKKILRSNETTVSLGKFNVDNSDPEKPKFIFNCYYVDGFVDLKRVNLSFWNLNDESISFSVSFDKSVMFDGTLEYNNESKQYVATMDIKFMQEVQMMNISEGDYYLNGIELVDVNDKRRQYSELSHDLGYGNSNSWKDIQIKIPEKSGSSNPSFDDYNLTSLKIEGFTNKMEAPTKLKVEFTTDKDISKANYYYISLHYFDESKKAIQVFNVHAEYDGMNKIGYVFELPKAAKYSKNYKFLYLSLHLDGTELKYSNYSKDYLDSNYSEFDGYYPFYYDNMKSLSGIVSPENLDIEVTNYVEDTTAPELISAGWVDEKIYLPAETAFVVKAKDDESKTVQALLYIEREGKLEVEYLYSYLDYEEFSLSFNFSRYDEKAEKVVGICLQDLVGNKKLYAIPGYKEKFVAGFPIDYGMIQFDEKDIEEIKSDFKLEKVNLQEYDEIISIADPSLNDKLENTPEGKTIVVNTDASTIISKDIFEAIKGKDITLIFEDTRNDSWNEQGVQWIINGLDISEECKTIDTSVEISTYNSKMKDGEPGFIRVPKYTEITKEKNIEFLEFIKSMLLEDNYYYQYLKTLDLDKDNFSEKYLEEVKKNEFIKLTFKPNGTLPGKSKIRVKLSYVYRDTVPNTNVNLYYVDGDKFELVNEDINIDEDDYYSVNINHNSTYVMTSLEEAEMNNTVDNDNNDKVDGEVNDDSKNETPSNTETEPIVTPDNTQSETLNTNQVKTGDNVNKGSLLILLGISGLSIIYLINKNKLKIR